MAHCRLQNREGIHEDIRVFTNSHQVDKKNPRQAGHRAWSLTLWKQDTVDFDFTVGRDIGVLLYGRKDIVESEWNIKN